MRSLLHGHGDVSRMNAKEHFVSLCISFNLKFWGSTGLLSTKIFNSLSMVIRFEFSFGTCGPFKISEENLDLISLYFVIQPALSRRLPRISSACV